MPKKTYKKKPDDPLKQMYIPELKMFTDAEIGGNDYRAISRHWKTLRAMRLQIDGYKCAQCGSAINLEVHHIRYPDAWGLENINDLITVCDSCHKKIHNMGKED